MNALLATITKNKLITPQNWKEISAGLIKDYEISTPTKDENGKITPNRKRFPVSCDITIDDCNSGKYKQLSPDTKKRAITYFEDQGSFLVRRDGDEFVMNSKLRLVCWVNMNRFVMGSECSIAARLIATILKEIPINPFNEGIFQKIKINFVRQASRNAAIFARYTYDEPVMQYLMSPYDYFALDFSIDYSLSEACFDTIELKDDPCAT